MLLGYIDYLVDSNKTFNTTFQIYDTLISKWIDREANKSKYKSTERDKFKKDLLLFSHKIALLMYENRAQSNQLSIGKERAKQVCAEDNLSLQDYEITGQSLLTRDANHNWKFAHKSIFEFFVAKEAINNIDFFQKIASSGFAGMDMSETFCREAGDWIFVKGGSYKFNDKIEVSISGFYIGKVTVTQKQWRKIMGNVPKELSFKGKDNNPVEGVSWNDAQEFIEQLKNQTGKFFRLPSEIEWEYAARGGNKSRRFVFSGGNNLNEVGWYNKNSKKSTHPTGLKEHNELGIYDMSGNVWEWCQDKWHEDLDGSNKNVTAWELGMGSDHVMRGGTWQSEAEHCWVLFRRKGNSDRRHFVGFRLVFVP